MYLLLTIHKVKYLICVIIRVGGCDALCERLTPNGLSLLPAEFSWIFMLCCHHLLESMLSCRT